MTELKDYQVILRDNRVNVELLPYIISACPSGDIAVVRAKARACQDAGLRHDEAYTFSMVSVEEYDIGYLTVV